MTFRMIHENYNVSDLEKSLAFYGEALGLREVRRNTQPGFTIVYLRDQTGHFELELTWLKDHPQKYDLGECEFHLAFAASDFEAAHKKHQEMGCICYENDAMGIYFIGQHRTIWQERSAKDFASYESYKRAGILYVFPSFITARMGQKIGRRPQTQLCGAAIEDPDGYWLEIVPVR